VQNTVLIDLNIQREERDMMNAQEEEEREVQGRLECSKDMRLEEELSNGKKRKFEWTPWRCPFPPRYVLVIVGHILPLALRKLRKD